MSGYKWFKGRCSCQMKDQAFRDAHGDAMSDRTI
jgi:hypothetical protein